MTGKGWTQFLTNKQQEYLENNLTVAVKESKWEYMETRRDPEKHGTIEGYYVLLGLTGDPHSGIHVASFSASEEGRIEAENCAEAIRKSFTYVKRHQYQKENPS